MEDQTQSPVISIRNLHKTFGDLRVLDGVDLELKKGENVAVLGRSGSGKSVLIKLIVGLLQADSGEIEVLGKRVTRLNKKELDQLRMHIGFSFQGSALYDSMSVFENLAFPLVMNRVEMSEEALNLSVENALNAVGLLDKKYTMPSELSGGQKKRVGIARALIMNPEIMLYDEPTGGLDPITSREINHLIVQIQKQYNTSSIIITHDLTCAKDTAQSVALLVGGKFELKGSFEEVFETGNEDARKFYDYNFVK